jgi:hypothetical protein
MMNRDCVFTLSRPKADQTIPVLVLMYVQSLEVGYLVPFRESLGVAALILMGSIVPDYYQDGLDLQPSVVAEEKVDICIHGFA